MNRINKLFRSGKRDILSVYFTAGYPFLDSTSGIIRDLEHAGADMIEIGIPFSDPVADGPVIQESSAKALKNGMSMELLFRQIEDIRESVEIPLLLMGYLNPVLQFGVENFCKKCVATGIDGAILPDLPPEIYNDRYSVLFKKHDILNIFLIAPQTSSERIKYIDSVSTGFIYMVSSSSTTGIKKGFPEEQTDYFRRIAEMGINSPRLTGFGISDNSAFRTACRVSHGAVTGSAFIKILGENAASGESIKNFIRTMKGEQ
jgi:tryptophan synthase alpha chain